MNWPLSLRFHPGVWVRQISRRRERRRVGLLCLRLREYFEERQRHIRGRFCPCVEQIVFEFEQRGYLTHETHEALRRLTQDGILEHLRGWYCLREHGG